jgi:hypothetical protein
LRRTVEASIQTVDRNGHHYGVYSFAPSKGRRLITSARLKAMIPAQIHGFEVCAAATSRKIAPLKSRTRLSTTLVIP